MVRDRPGCDGLSGLTPHALLMKIRGQHLETHYALLIAPAFAIFFFGMLVPVGMGFYYSLTGWDGLSKELPFVGLQNYVRIFTDSKFMAAISFTLKFAALNTLVQNVFALLFALILDAQLKAKTLYRTIIFVPVLFSPILTGYLWKVVFAKLIPSLFKLAQIPHVPSVLASPKTVLFGVVIINNWQWIGYWMMVYLAALQAIPRELYEAGDLDGATGWKSFRWITLPMLAPAITVCVLAITLGSFRVYELLVTSTAGGPGHASASIIYYTFDMAFKANQPGYASAISMFYLLFLLLIAVAQLRFFRGREVQL